MTVVWCLGHRARMLVASAWLLALLLSLPIGVLYHERLVQGRQQCWIEFSEPWQWQLYMTLVATAVFVAPAFIISVCYAYIVTTIWAKSKLYSHSKCNYFCLLTIFYFV